MKKKHDCRGHKDYGYLRPENADKTYHIQKGQVLSGYTVGIMVLNVWYPILPGNVASATSYNFPVRHRVVPGSDQKRMHSGDPTLLEDLIATGRELELEGCRVICGACGYFGHFQRQVADALDVPVFLSSLIQIPWIKSVIRTNQKVGVICADKPSLSPQLWESCGVNPDDCIAEEIPRGSEFDRFLYSDRGSFDNKKIRALVVSTALKMVTNHSEIGAVLLECSDMPPYAADVQRTIDLPVFDYITMIRYAHSAVAQLPYEGFI